MPAVCFFGCLVNTIQMKRGLQFRKLEIVLNPKLPFVFS